MLRQRTITPEKLTEKILEFCRDISPTETPDYLMVQPVLGAEEKDCFAVIEKHVAEHGGKIVYGWQIWEWPLVLLEAEFHAVWEDGNGGLNDLTPKPPHINKILFLRDDQRQYNGVSIDNIRKPSSEYQDIADFIQANENYFEFMNRGSRKFEFGDIQILGDEIDELEGIERRRQQTQLSILSRLNNIGRNSPCPCGSGKKYKKCHGA